jgi:hypothetical protein
MILGKPSVAVGIAGINPIDDEETVSGTLRIGRIDRVGVKRAFAEIVAAHAASPSSVAMGLENGALTTRRGLAWLFAVLPLVTRLV